MKYGFVKVAAATPALRVADVRYNADNIIAECGRAYEAGVQILVFPELSLTGYTCGDLFHQQALVEGAKREAERVVKESRGREMLCFVGLPVLFAGRLYNCALAFSDGKPLGLVPKSSLPNYNEFYEMRHFAPADGVSGEVELCGERVPLDAGLLFRDENQENAIVGCEICEDLWTPAPPSVKHALNGATIVVNLSASNEVIGKREYRRDLVRMQSGRLVCGYVYASAGTGESTTDTVYSAHNMIAQNGSLLREGKLFADETVIGEIDVDRLAYERKKMTTFFSEAPKERPIAFRTPVRPCDLSFVPSRLPFVPQGEKERGERAELILSMQAAGLAKRMEHTRSRTAVIGISGGLDSALAFLVTVRAFDRLGKPRKDILTVTMPGFGTTAKTKNNATAIVEALGAELRSISISEAVSMHFEAIGHDPSALDATYENAQARMRTLILMDLANQTGGIVVGTGDLSESALGWATYNGDHMSMYAVNASVPKTLVKYLVAHEASRLGGEAGRILDDILHTEISPELLPPTKEGEIAQKTEDLVGPYELHDFYLYHAIRWGFPPKKVEYLATLAFAGKYDGAVVRHWLKVFYKRFFSQQFKRSCMPDSVKIGSVTLSPRADWRMPSDAVSALWLEETEREDN